jgi:hypothetical protein
MAGEDADNKFTKQRITITVPASFDEGAQLLTREAAELAGFSDQVRLLEEPQAAFYAWIEAASHDASRPPGAYFLALLPELKEQDQTVLVCDIGGGTTDLSLFRIGSIASEREFPRIERIAVSDHLLLGGDNIDLTLAHLLEKQLKPGADERLTRREWNHLVPQARLLKEKVLAGDGLGEDGEVFHVSILGESANIFQSSLSTTITRAGVRSVILDGFFPFCAAGDRPAMRQTGLREIGLPYAVDTAVSRHLAAFLDGQSVDAILCAGGTLQPPFLQERLLSIVEGWQDKRPALLALSQEDMSLAIARGAAYFGYLLGTSKRRIQAGQARSVYLELHREQAGAAPDLVCILPQGFDEGGMMKLTSPSFSLLLNRPARFTAYTSTHRKADRAGEIVALKDDAFLPLPPLHTTLTLDEEQFDPRKASALQVAVQLETQLTELGVMQLALYSPEHKRRWKLEFNLRKAVAGGEGSLPETPEEGLGVSQELFQQGLGRIQLFYGGKKDLDEKESVKTLIKDLERILGQERNQWSLPLLRALWPALYPGMTRRGRSLAHENTWLYLAGFLLRPGYGAELDPWRMSQLWGSYKLGVTNHKEKSAQSNWWMMWRRVAGGLSTEQQGTLFDDAMPQFKKSPAEFAEGTRLLGALERIPLARRLELTKSLFEMLLKRKDATPPHVFWALTRLLSRVPLYTAADGVIPPEKVEDYFGKLEVLDWKKLNLQALVPLFTAACRRTGNRALDIHDPVRERVLQKLKQTGAKEEQLKVVRELCEISSEERNLLFGEALPVGLRLAKD